ncbi:hypothetical protein Btru_057739 [Bulinus truncatus]|nr:hypothetical protein Btru_057739 [Bulinus truncatus]
MNLHNAIPISTPTTFLFAPSGSHLTLNSAMSDAPALPVMPQGPLGYQHAGAYTIGNQVSLPASHVTAANPGMQAPMCHHLPPFAGSVGNVAIPPLTSGLIQQGQAALPAQNVYGHFVLAQQPQFDGQTYQWAPHVGANFAPGASQLPSGIIEYQSLLAQGTDLQATPQHTSPAHTTATATQQSTTTQSNSEFSFAHTYSETEQPNGIHSPKGEYSQKSSEKESSSSYAGGYQQQAPSLSRQNNIPSSLPPKLNPSLQLSTFGNSRSSTDGSGNSPRRGSSTSSVTSPVTSPRGQEILANVAPCYERPVKRDQCLRCFKKVYPLEQVGPIKEVMYHKTCFTCVTCGTQLNLKNFGHNPNDLDDLNVFCTVHRPKERTLSMDADSIHIKRALTAPKLDKVNEQIRGDRYPSEVLARSSYGQPSASALVNRPENVYYGMGSGNQQQLQQHHQQQQPQQHQQQQQQQQPQQHQQQQHHQQQQPQQHQHQQQQYDHYGDPGDSPHGRQQQQLDNYPGCEHPPVQRQHQVDCHVVYDHTPHQRQESWEGSAAHFTAPVHNHNAASTTYVIRHDRQISHDDVFDSQVVDATDGRRPAPTNYQPSRSDGAPIRTNDGPAMDVVVNELSSKIKVIRVDSGYSGKDDAPLMRSDRPSNRSSRSASPDRLSRTSSRHEDSHSVRSSTGSNISGHDFSDLDSSLTHHRFQQTSSTSSMERSDRPSMSSAHELGVRVRVEMTRGSGKPEANDLTHVDLSRHLPPNEVRRMDRPSQYS